MMALMKAAMAAILVMEKENAFFLFTNNK